MTGTEELAQPPQTIINHRIATQLKAERAIPSLYGKPIEERLLAVRQTISSQSLEKLDYRTENRLMGFLHTPSPEQIAVLFPQFMEMFNQTYDKLKSKQNDSKQYELEVLTFTSLVYNMSMLIHPFFDGNRRTLSLITLSYLHELLPQTQEWFFKFKPSSGSAYALDSIIPPDIYDSISVDVSGQTPLIRKYLEENDQPTPDTVRLTAIERQIYETGIDVYELNDIKQEHRHKQIWLFLQARLKELSNLNDSETTQLPTDSPIYTMSQKFVEAITTPDGVLELQVSRQHNMEPTPEVGPRLEQVVIANTKEDLYRCNVETLHELRDTLTGCQITKKKIPDVFAYCKNHFPGILEKTAIYGLDGQGLSQFGNIADKIYFGKKFLTEPSIRGMVLGGYDTILLKMVDGNKPDFNNRVTLIHEIAHASAENELCVPQESPDSLVTVEPILGGLEAMGGDGNWLGTIMEEGFAQHHAGLFVRENDYDRQVAKISHFFGKSYPVVKIAGKDKVVVCRKKICQNGETQTQRLAIDPELLYVTENRLKVVMPTYAAVIYRMMAERDSHFEEKVSIGRNSQKGVKMFWKYIEVTYPNFYDKLYNGVYRDNFDTESSYKAIAFDFFEQYYAGGELPKEPIVYV